MSQTITVTENTEHQTTTSTVTKPGYKTTEFWLSLVAVVLGALASSGSLADGSTAARVVGLAIAALGALGYSVSRGMAKSA